MHILLLLCYIDRSLSSSHSDEDDVGVSRRVKRTKSKSRSNRPRTRRRKNILQQLEFSGMPEVIHTIVNDNANERTKLGVTCETCGLVFRRQNDKYFQHIKVKKNDQSIWTKRWRRVTTTQLLACRLVARFSSAQSHLRVLHEASLIQDHLDGSALAESEASIARIFQAERERIANPTKPMTRGYAMATHNNEQGIRRKPAVKQLIFYVAMILTLCHFVCHLPL